MTNAEKMEEVFGFPSDNFSGYICDSMADCPERNCKHCFGISIKWEDEYKGKINVSESN